MPNEVCQRTLESKFTARLLVLAVLLVFGASGCASDRAFKKRQADRALNVASRALAMDDTTLALQQLLEAQKNDPDNPHIHYNLGITYTRKEVLDKAEYHFKQAVRLKPDFSEAYNNLGVLYLRQGQVDQAIEALKKALDSLLYLNPQHAHLNLGRAYLLKKDYNKAAEHFQRAVKLVPDYVAAYYFLGLAYEGLEEDREAIRAYRQVVKFVPNNVPAHLNLGKLLYRTGEKQAAVDSFSEVIRLAPNSAAAEKAQRYLDVLR
ncbi:MAG: tetratricopeptide repeat protein [Syntrophobacteria bacterium]